MEIWQIYNEFLKTRLQICVCNLCFVNLCYVYIHTIHAYHCLTAKLGLSDQLIRLPRRCVFSHHYVAEWINPTYSISMCGGYGRRSEWQETSGPGRTWEAEDVGQTPTWFCPHRNVFVDTCREAQPSQPECLSLKKYSFSFNFHQLRQSGLIGIGNFDFRLTTQVDWINTDGGRRLGAFRNNWLLFHIHITYHEKSIKKWELNGRRDYESS